MFTFKEITERLDAYEPLVLPITGRRQAAVAMVLREGDEGAEVLFIERARREGDPWSGHMAFPGGRLEPSDRSPAEAAERETSEEVGVSLEDARYLGRLDDLRGRPQSRSGDMVVSAHVYHLVGPAGMVLNHEVAAAFWFPLAGLHEEQRQVEYPYYAIEEVAMPGILVGEPERHIVWGLTYRFLEVFFEVVERPFPPRW